MCTKLYKHYMGIKSQCTQIGGKDLVNDTLCSQFSNIINLKVAAGLLVQVTSSGMNRHRCHPIITTSAATIWQTVVTSVHWFCNELVPHQRWPISKVHHPTARSLRSFTGYQLNHVGDRNLMIFVLWKYAETWNYCNWCHCREEAIIT